MTVAAAFPIDLDAFKPVVLDPAQPELTDDQAAQLQANIQLCRDAIIFFTATGAAKGLGGHTGGPYDIVPEVLIADGFIRHGSAYPAHFDEAGHRVAIQYLLAVLYGDLPAMQLTRYREANEKLPGHPELGLTPGVRFSSGRLGHMWGHVNGVAFAHPDQSFFLFGSDGSQQEGNDAEAARIAVAHKLNVKIVVDDNDVTIADHPSNYIPGFHVGQTLEGHGLHVDYGDGEDLPSLYARMARAASTPGPVALINKRVMAPGVPHIEGSVHGHDVIPVDAAVEYLDMRGHADAVQFLKAITKPKNPATYRGVDMDALGSNRNEFGKAVNRQLAQMSKEERIDKVRVFDSDLEGSCGLIHIHKEHPEVFVASGIMERSNYAAASGFGFTDGRQGIMGTFAAFQEMCISEITMARLNKCNVLAHFSHSGVDDMADNTCHFGLNNMFADNGLPEDGHDQTRLYFPADAGQMHAVIDAVFHDPGLRFVYSTRSKTPTILGEDGKPLHGDGYTFIKDKDEIVREGKAGYVVSFGEALYRALDAVEQLRAKGVDVGLINKPTLNVVDEDAIQKIGRSPLVVVVEGFNVKTGLGARFGTWLLERGLTPRYAHLGTNKEGCGGLWEQYPYQGLDPESIIAAVEKLM